MLVECCAFEKSTYHRVHIPQSGTGLAVVFVLGISPFQSSFRCCLVHAQLTIDREIDPHWYCGWNCSLGRVLALFHPADPSSLNLAIKELYVPIDTAKANQHSTM
jgi:hypothetical protein